MKKDLRNEAYGKSVIKDVLSKLNYRLPRCYIKQGFFNTLTTYNGQMKGGKIPLVATFKTCFDDHLGMIKVVVRSNNGNPKKCPTCIAWKCTQYCYIHGTQILKQIDQCKKGLRLERCNRVNINIIKERKKTIMSTTCLKELKI